MNFDGTLRDLIRCYKTDPYSKYVKPEKKGGLRHATKANYTSLTNRLGDEHGDVLVSDIDGRKLTDWHEAWLGTDEDNQKIAMGHSLISMIRTLVTYGGTMLKNPACREVKAALHDMRFKMPKSRTERLTVEQVIAIRTTARAMGLSSIARAQAFQFECTFRQKDVIGEWVPLPKPETEITTILTRYEQWSRGICWEEIDERMVLHHVTSKRQKAVKKSLLLMPMVLDELQAHYCDLGEPLTRDKLPATGPVIIYEESGRPFFNFQFRRLWREIATAAGIPENVTNMDTRAGAITEALRSGARKDSVRKAATHSTAQMTEKYDRGDEEDDAEVSQSRVASRMATKGA